MPLNTALVIATLTLLIGVFFSEQHLWIPASVLATAIVDSFTRSWVTSNSLGQWTNASAFLKFLLALVMTYATIGQLACFVLLGWWLFT